MNFMQHPEIYLVRHGETEWNVSKHYQGQLDSRLTANGESAMYIDARIDCSGNRGFCAGSGGATYGNLGAEHGSYRLRRKGGGYEIEKLGVSVIS